jgi:malonate-semialdehyde dehydrogenase (acetylating)/methylmalonate-semialdehyde dehydrogenase
MTGQLERLGHYVDGRRISGTSGRSAPVFNPALGVATLQVDLASADETRAVIASAAAALPEWAATPPLRRARVLFRYRELIEQHSDELAGIITREHGKVLPDARGEATRGLEIVEFACGIPHLLKGEYSDAVGRDMSAASAFTGA